MGFGFPYLGLHARDDIAARCYGQHTVLSIQELEEEIQTLKQA